MPLDASYPDLDSTLDAQGEDAPLPFDYQKRAILDTAQRMSTGLLLYPAIWPVLMLVDGYLLRHPAFVWGNFVVLLAATLGRRLYHRRIQQQLERDFVGTQRAFRAMSLGYNLYWGILCATVMTASDADTLRWMMLMATVGITAGGTVIVAVDSVLPLLYPLCTLGPVVTAVLPHGGGTNIAIAVLTAVFFAYSLGISRLVGREYWARQRVQALLEQRAHELEAISRTDALTQIPNRLRFQEVLDRSWRDARRRKEPLAVAMVDLDHFKRINDQHGHPFGDRCLQSAARALQSAVHRPGDLVARYGGEEFIVLMPNTDLEGARKVADRLLANVADTIVRQGDQAVQLSCSVGLSLMVPGLNAQAENLVQQADAALYRAKQEGRARVACHLDIAGTTSQQASQASA